MAHFPESVWADAARGIATDADREAVQAHLDSGCAECRSEMETWTRFASVAKVLRSEGPTEDLVRPVLTEFSLQQPKREKRVIVPLLVFDTLGQAAFAGVRSGMLATRQVLYEVEGIAVDLRVERQGASNRISVIGQVIEREGVPVGPLPFTVTSEKGKWGLHSHTTEFGEFHFEIDAEEPTKFVVELTGNRVIELPLRDLQISLPR